MRTIHSFITAGALLSAVSLPAFGASTLAEYAFNIDGTVSDYLLPAPPPAGVNIAGFNTGTGLGTIQMTMAGTGLHYGGVFLDHEIDEIINTFFNETGAKSGAPSSGLSWEIDEPGWKTGDIFTNFGASNLDNTNSSLIPDDVSMALAWNFTLNPGETALLSFNVSETMPTSGFYLSQTDPASQESLYFTSSLAVQGQSVPDAGSSLALLLCAMTGIVGWRSARKP
ncbi:MAG: VPDSG-CTERM sorting domain-containing protein [Verrucomicrobiota bacterium]